MARIRSFSEGAQSVSENRSEVDCFHQVIVSPSGERYLHLSTFGSDERQSKPKSSQSIQIDEETASGLMDALREAFPNLR